jgi:hypothetical protein
VPREGRVGGRCADIRERNDKPASMTLARNGTTIIAWQAE